MYTLRAMPIYRSCVHVDLEPAIGPASAALVDSYPWLGRLVEFERTRKSILTQTPSVQVIIAAIELRPTIPDSLSFCRRRSSYASVFGLLALIAHRSLMFFRASAAARRQYVSGPTARKERAPKKVSEAEGTKLTEDADL